MKYFALTFLLVVAAAVPAAQVPEYSIEAIRFANSPGDSVATMVMGAPENETVDTIYALWLIRGGRPEHSLRQRVSPRSLVRAMDRRGLPAAG